MPLLDLSGKRKVFFVVGESKNGKTTWLRWLTYRTGKAAAELTLVTADQHNLDLLDYFEDVGRVPPEHAAVWLRQFFSWLADRQGSAAINFSGNDSILPSLIQRYPNLIRTLHDAELEPVLAVFLSPRDNDLTILGVLQEIGFVPSATMLVCNLGTVDGTPDYTAFNPIVRHKAFTRATDAGGVTIWMPKLGERKLVYSIEHARLKFETVLAPTSGFDMLDRGLLQDWLDDMERAHTAIASWLP